MAPEPVHETPLTGLTAAEVQERVARGATNTSSERTSRTFGEIVRANVFTRFNAILGVLLVVILAVGHPQDALFGVVLVSNALIGIIQELRAKRTLDQLAVLSAPQVRVVRDREVREVGVDDVVLDDVVELRTGDQIAADGVVRATTALQVDESLLTGESDPVDKDIADHVLSGSFVVAGSGKFQATAVGDDAYARKLAAEARRFQLARSELMDGINRILRYVTWAIPVVSVLLLVSQFNANDDWREAISGTVAGVVGMVPQGLVLLTSVAFGVAAVTLARRKVLVQELPAVEGLARVDVVCFDKTGTLTDGNIVFDRLERLDDQAPVEAALGALGADEDRNATLNAIAEAFPPTDSWSRTGFVPFSSARKWSAATFGDRGTWVLGAPEMVWAGRDGDVSAQAATLAATGQRVLLLARTDDPLDGEALPAGLRAVALLLFEEQVRPDAADTLTYFAQQGVALNVISGDNPGTVGAVAGRVGMPRADDPFDARRLPEDLDQLGKTLEEHSVFGRVTPHQKQDMVKARQPVCHQDRMGDAAGRRRRHRAVAVPVPPASPDDHRHADDRHPVLLPRSGAEPPAVCPGLRRSRAPVHDPGRFRRRHRRLGGLRAGALRRPPFGRAAHGRHARHADDEPDRSRDPRPAVDVAAGRPRRADDPRVRPAVPDRVRA